MVLSAFKEFVQELDKNVCLNQTTKFVWFRIIERNKFFASIDKTYI